MTVHKQALAIASLLPLFACSYSHSKYEDVAILTYNYACEGITLDVLQDEVEEMGKARGYAFDSAKISPSGDAFNIRLTDPRGEMMIMGSRPYLSLSLALGKGERISREQRAFFELLARRFAGCELLNRADDTQADVRKPGAQQARGAGAPAK